MYKKVTFFSVITLLTAATAQLCIAASSSQPQQENRLNRQIIPIETTMKEYELRIQKLEAKNRELTRTVEEQEHALHEMNKLLEEREEDKEDSDNKEKYKEHYEKEIAMLVEMIDESIEKVDKDASIIKKQESQIKDLQRQLHELTKTVIYCAVEVTNPMAENYEKKQSIIRALKTAALQAKTEKKDLLESIFTELIDYMHNPAHKKEIEGGITKAADARNSGNL